VAADRDDHLRPPTGPWASMTSAGTSTPVALPDGSTAAENLTLAPRRQPHPRRFLI
jgi:hypothetical protein